MVTLSQKGQGHCPGPVCILFPVCACSSPAVPFVLISESWSWLIQVLTGQLLCVTSRPDYFLASASPHCALARFAVASATQACGSCFGVLFGNCILFGTQPLPPCHSNVIQKAAQEPIFSSKESPSDKKWG